MYYLLYYLAVVKMTTEVNNYESNIYVNEQIVNVCNLKLNVDANLFFCCNLKLLLFYFRRQLHIAACFPAVLAQV